jgi:carboxypeptidase Taq
MIALTKKMKQTTHLSVYDALLDDFQPGLTTNQVTTVFEQLKQDLIPLMKKIRKSGRKIDNSFLKSKSTIFDIGKQKVLNRKIAKEVVQFDPQKSRIDTSTHPFTTSVDPGDVRFTARYRKHEFFQAIADTVHEAGHTLYETQLNPKYPHQPVQQPLGMGVHESQVRINEMCLTCNRVYFGNDTYY